MPDVLVELLLSARAVAPDDGVEPRLIALRLTSGADVGVPERSRAVDPRWWLGALLVRLAAAGPGGDSGAW